MLGILLISMGIAQLFALFNFQEATLVIIFMLAVLIITQVTSHYLYGIISSFLSVLIFNFFFTEPYFSFNTHQPDYVFTFFILLVASMIFSTLTSRLKTAKQMAAIRFNQIELLSELNQSFILNDLKEALLHSEDILKKYYGFEVAIDVLNDQEPHKTISSSTFEILASKKVIGYVEFKVVSPFNHDELVFAKTIVNSLSQSIERQLLITKQVEVEFEIREQKLKNNLLATIIGSTETILQAGENLSHQDRTLLLQNVLDDARWLIDSVQNILSFIQVDEHIKLNMNLESVEELFGDVVSHVVGYAKQHIELSLPSENIFLKMDVRLMEKVLINLVHNAIKYSSDDSTITLRAKIKQDHLIFEVCDQGQGIPDALKSKVFDRFMTAQEDTLQKRKGLGLGLAICKAIVEAHHGRISIKDNVPSGTIIRCSFPYEVNHD